MSEEIARKIYAILVKYAGAKDDDWAARDFAHYLAHESHQFIEYRFMGLLGMGGKFYATHAQKWHVNCYREDMTEKRQVIITSTNNALSQLEDAQP